MLGLFQKKIKRWEATVNKTLADFETRAENAVSIEIEKLVQNYIEDAELDPKDYESIKQAFLKGVNRALKFVCGELRENLLNRSEKMIKKSHAEARTTLKDICSASDITAICIAGSAVLGIDLNDRIEIEGAHSAVDILLKLIKKDFV